MPLLCDHCCHEAAFLYFTGMQANSFLLYGANGYTGELIARFAANYGLQPVIAGRNRHKITALANRLQLPYKVFDLNDNAALIAALQEVKVIVHAAGPYDHTAQPVIEACLQTNTHYLDLNGDYEVFDLIRQYDHQAKEKGVMLLPGAGYDVVPTDCLALWLKRQLPEAESLELAFTTIGSALSRGTAITSLLKAGMPGAVREQGRIVQELLGKRGMWVNFPGLGKKVFAMSLPWGDISTAYISTGIPNVTVYFGVKHAMWQLLKAQSGYNWLLRSKPFRTLANRVIRWLPAGPDDKQRAKARTLVWGKVTDKLQSRTGTLTCPDAYTVTTDAILLIAGKILKGNFKPGYQTPATAYGEDLVLELPGVVRSLQ
jgi:short subunit dehydrogenase-like uncharacterized protein